MPKPTLVRSARPGAPVAPLDAPVEALSAAPLVALPPLRAPLEGPGFAAAAATGARLVWQTRRLLFAPLAVIVVIAVGAGQLPGSFAGPAGEWLLGLALLAFGLLRGLDGRSRHAAFWVGAGLSPTGLELGAVGLDLGAMTLAWALAGALGAGPWGVTSSGLLLGLLAYGAASGTRASAHAEAGRALRLVGWAIGALFSCAAVIATGYGTLAAAIGWALGLCGLSGLLLRLLTAHRWPESAAGRGRPRPTWALSALAGLLAAPVLAAQGPDPRWAVPTPTYSFEHQSFFPARWAEYGTLYRPWGIGSARFLWWAAPGEAPARLPVRGLFLWTDQPSPLVVSWRRLPDQALLSALLRGELTGGPPYNGVPPAFHDSPAVVDGVRLADGTVVECEAQVWGTAWGPQWVSDDGLQAEGVDAAGQRWHLDADGCRPVEPAAVRR